MSDVVPFADLGASTREVRQAVSRGWAELLDSNQFIGGPATEDFERAWARYCGVRYAVGVGNGTDALQLTLMALAIGPGDEVVVPANTFVATVEAIVLAGAVPRFADVSPDTLLLAADSVAEVLNARTKAVVVVHLYGQMPDMDALARLADRAGVALIEDAAQAHGATWRGRPAGSFGIAGCFSFYPGKNLGAFGDAGAVVTSDADLAGRLRCVRDHGRVDGSHYQHAMLGTNSRLDALQAVVLTAKLARLDGWNARRRAIAERYREALDGGPVRLVAELPGSRGVYHLAVLRVPQRDRVQERLASMGVQTRVHYPTPCHLQPPYRRFADMRLPVAEQAADEVLSLPMFPQMGNDQVARVLDALGKVRAAEEAYVA